MKSSKKEQNYCLNYYNGYVLFTHDENQWNRQREKFSHGIRTYDSS